MYIIQLTEGNGKHYGGAGIRDHALIISLRRLGHKVTFACFNQRALVEEEEAWTAPVFYEQGRIALEQTSRLYRILPQSLAGMLEKDWFQGRSTNKIRTASPDQRGDFLISLLKGRDGRQARELDALIAWLRKENPDIISLSSVKHVAAVPLIKSELNKPIVVNLVGQYREFHSLPKSYRDESWNLVAEAVKQADSIIVPSTYFADLMSNELSIPIEQFQVIPNGISLNYYSIRPAPPPKPTIGFLGRLSEGCGLEHVIEVFQKLKKKRIPELELRVAGALDDDDVEYLAETMEPVSQTDVWNVRFFPNIPLTQKITYLHDLSLLCVPAKYEAFGNYLIEAMAVGLPVVQPDTCAFPEIIEKTGGGLLYPDGKLDILMDKLEGLLTDNVGSTKLGQAGRQGVLEYYSSERMAGEVLEVYRSAMNA